MPTARARWRCSCGCSGHRNCPTSSAACARTNSPTCSRSRSPGAGASRSPTAAGPSSGTRRPALPNLTGLNIISHLLSQIPYKTIPHEKVVLPKRKDLGKKYKAIDYPFKFIPEVL